MKTIVIGILGVVVAAMLGGCAPQPPAACNITI